VNQGYQFEVAVPDGDIYKVYYRDHFVERFDTDQMDHPAVKRRITEETIRAKIEEAIPKIDQYVYQKSTVGVIVSESFKFVMLFDAVETSYGRELNMFNMSNRVDFKPKSAKEIIIKVNPSFLVKFSTPLSNALKIFILADIADNWKVMEPGVLYHLGGDLMDYWLERSGNDFYISRADWSRELLEIEVT
jgi:hypothetical protein